LTIPPTPLYNVYDSVAHLAPECKKKFCKHSPRPESKFILKFKIP
jgi:hypothetical protein